MNQPHKPAPGRVAAAKRASAARTRAKHERWAAELAGVLDHIEVEALKHRPFVYLDCKRCGEQVASYEQPTTAAQILNDAIGHTCPPDQPSKEGT